MYGTWAGVGSVWATDATAGTAPWYVRGKIGKPGIGGARNRACGVDYHLNPPAQRQDERQRQQRALASRQLREGLLPYRAERHAHLQACGNSNRQVVQCVTGDPVARTVACTYQLHRHSATAD